MSDLMLVLWLQSGEKLGEQVVRGEGAPPGTIRTRAGADELTWRLTAPRDCDAGYRLGRRRFHYIETTGWEPPGEPSLEERSGPDWMPAYVQAALEAFRQHRALEKVGGVR